MHIIYKIHFKDRILNDIKPYYYIGSKINCEIINNRMYDKNIEYKGSSTYENYLDIYNSSDIYVEVLKEINDYENILIYEKEFQLKFDVVKSLEYFNKAYSTDSKFNKTGYSNYMHKDDNNMRIKLKNDDPLVLSGEYISINTNLSLFYTEDGLKMIDKNHPKVLDKSYKHVSYNKGIYRNKDDESDIRKLDTNDDLVLSGEFISIMIGYSIYKNVLNETDIKRLKPDDPLVLSKQYIPITSNKALYRHKKDESITKMLNTDDPLISSGEYISVMTGYSIYKNVLDESDIRKLKTDDQLVLSGQFISISTGYGIYKNKDNYDDIKKLKTDDPLVLSGEYISIMTNYKFTDEQLQNQKDGFKKLKENTEKYDQYCQNISNALVEIWKDKDAAKKRINNIKNSYNEPGKREKHGNSIKAAKAKMTDEQKSIAIKKQKENIRNKSEEEKLKTKLKRSASMKGLVTMRNINTGEYLRILVSDKHKYDKSIWITNRSYTDIMKSKLKK